MSKIREQDVNKVAEALYRSRNIAGKSQEFMALELDVSRKTIQNWEKGVSTPTIEKAVEWFRILKTSPIPFLFRYVFPSMEQMDENSSEAELRDALQTLIDALPTEGVKQLLYLFYGEHGSSPRGVVNLMTAHLHTSMRDRVVQARVIVNNYELSQKKNELVCPEQVQPDMDFLKRACNEGESAVINDETAYVCKE